MLYPEINELKEKAGSRYYLVSMASKRARDLIETWDPERGYRKLDGSIETDKPVSIAAEEIDRDLFTYIPAEQIAAEEEAAAALAEAAEAQWAAEEAEEAAEAAEAAAEESAEAPAEEPDPAEEPEEAAEAPAEEE